MKYLLFLLLAGCLDLDGLQSGLCGAQKISCSAGTYCNGETCVTGTKPDMQSPSKIDTCISMYFPFFQPSWYPFNYYPSNVGKACSSCTESFNSTCSGRIIKYYYCNNSQGFRISTKRFVEKSSINPTVYLLSDVDPTAKVVLYQQVISGDINSPTEICSRGQVGSCIISPDYRRSYNSTLCEAL
jgi:hypothetical protein